MAFLPINLLSRKREGNAAGGLSTGGPAAPRNGLKYAGGLCGGSIGI